MLISLYSESPSIVAFLVLQGLEDLTQELWQKPASLQPTSRREEHFYKIKKEPFNYLTTHPPPSSLVMEEMQPKGHQAFHSTPIDREQGKLDVLNWNLYSSAVLGFKISNYETVMAGYQIFFMEEASTFLELLPEDNWFLAKILHTKAIKLLKQQTDVAQHFTDSTAQAMVSSIVLRCHMWLRLPMETKLKAEYLPFKDFTFFSAKTDEMLFLIKKNKQTTNSLGVS